MWDEDEDNNPYASGGEASNAPFSPQSATAAAAVIDATPPESPLYVIKSPTQAAAAGYDDERSSSYRPLAKDGAYHGRVEKILFESEKPILIVYGGKNSESGGKHIAYVVQTGELQVRRRYSEFASLRQTLVKLHPTLIIPPIPEKHSMADYAAKPTTAKEDAAIIELRKRMLATFLNRCRNMRLVLEDGVWWRFLDPNVSWNEVLKTRPVSEIPKQILRAPPMEPANPTIPHSYLPLPSASAKLKSYSRPATSTPPVSSVDQAFGNEPVTRFPSNAARLSEQELDPYFNSYEAYSKELETLLQGGLAKVNSRTIKNYDLMSRDLRDLGANYNAFSLSDQSESVAGAIGKLGQTFDDSSLYIVQFLQQLSAGFAEPMRESAQFAGVVRSVLRYRVLKRVQEEMAQDELVRKQQLLLQLQHQEDDSRTMGATLSQYTAGGSLQSPASPHKPPLSSPASLLSPSRMDDDVASVDSDFPPTHGDASPGFASLPSAHVGEAPYSPSAPRKTKSAASFIPGDLFRRMKQALQGVIDTDSAKTRQDSIGKTMEHIQQMEEAIQVSGKDVKAATQSVLADLNRFQSEKEEDLKYYMLAFAKCHIDYARKNLEYWKEAKAAVEDIRVEHYAREE